jgi:PAS domain S-box-containing protein
MNLKIKSKLYLGITLLFILIILIGVASIYSINRLGNDSKMILKSNYESIQYAKNMQQIIDNGKLKSDTDTRIKFEQNLIAQENNITEIGEKEATTDLQAYYEKFKALKDTSKASIVNYQSSIKQSLYKIEELNLNAIVRKNNDVQQTTDKAKLYVGIFSSFCFLVSLFLLVSFPGYVVKPVKRFAEGIKQISKKNYSQRLDIRQGDEFGELAIAFNSMAEKLEEYNNSNLAKLMMEKKRIETIINNMPNPIIGFDENQKIIFVNNEALKILDLEADNIIGKMAQDISFHNDLMRSLTQDLLNQTNENKNEKKLPMKIYANNKESYFDKEIIAVTAAPVGETEVKHIGDVIILQNITTFQEKDVAKTNFLATISHELKTPLASTDIGLKLLHSDKTGPLNNQQKEIVTDIQKDNNRLIKLVNELLDLSQADTGNINLTINTTSAKEIIEFAANSMKQQANDKNVSIEIMLDENLRPMYADKEKATWVLINLLSNAIRYSPPDDKIIITAKNTLENKIEISVKDNGSGIPKEYNEKIFQRFFRVPTTTSFTKGTGLGLSISKEFMTAMGGSIYLNSDIGVGSEFVLSFQSV